MKKVFSLFLALVLLILPAAGLAEYLADGLSPEEAFSTVLACAQPDGIEPGSGSRVQDAERITAEDGGYLLAVEIRDGRAYSASVALAQINMDNAVVFGRIFGRMLRALCNFTDASPVLASLDFNVFNYLKYNTQTAVFGDYMITVTVDPDAAYPYSLAVSLSD